MPFATQQNKHPLWDGDSTTIISASKEQKIIHYLGLVKYVVRQMRIAQGIILTQNDLLHFGIIGLNEAIDNFDTTKQVKFETYAIPRIKGTILDEIRKLDWVPRSVRQKIRSNNQAIQDIERENGREALREEVAKKLSITPREYDKLLDEAHRVLAYDSSVYQRSEEVFDIEEIGEIDDSNDPFELLNSEESRQILIETIERLPKKHRLVIALFYYEELSFTEISEVMRLSISRISQIHTEALEILRDEIKVTL
ncbi:MAG: FliA/WhiG family RNA polymerase sigma factor [Bacteroidota bacterium]